MSSAESVKARLKNISKETGKTMQELLITSRRTLVTLVVS